jgi:hypothetical protein
VDAALLTYFFVDNHIDLNTLLSLAFEKSIKAPFRKIGRRAPEIEFRSQPPILFGVSASIKHLDALECKYDTDEDENALFCTVQDLRQRPEVVEPVDMPDQNQIKQCEPLVY